MKAHDHRVLILAALFSMIPFLNLRAQDTARKDRQNQKEAAIEQMVNSRQFRFLPQTATPMTGGSRQLVYDYELKFNRDTLQAYLPYFGRAYQSSYGTADEGIHFMTTDFSYGLENGKKGGWDLSFTPRGLQNISEISMYISTAGYATVQVMSNTRQMISFYGYIQPLH